MDVAVAGYMEVGSFRQGPDWRYIPWRGGLFRNRRGLVLRETINRPGISVGVENLIGEENYEFYRHDNDSLYNYPNAQNFSIYGVITKDFSYFISLPICLNIGFGTGRFQQSDEAVDGFENPLPGVFGSILAHPSMDSEIMVEWDGRDLNVGGLYRLNRNSL